ncbi:MAG: metal ABC transporter solute-binding protein, Zn/Mn family [Actinomycetota bacterium]
MWNAQHRDRVLAAALAAAIAVGLLGACSPGSSSPDADGVRVAAAAYPFAEAARWVGGGAVRVDDLTPPGTEPHDLEVTADVADALLDADLGVVAGGAFQPALEYAAARRDGPTLVAVEVPGIEGDDPHVWLDPVTMGAVVRATRDALLDVDGVDAASVRRGSRRALDRLRSLDAEYRVGLAQCDRRTLVTAHDAFGRLAARYDLRVESIAGLSPEEEPEPRRLASLARLVRAEGITTVFTEELVSPRVAEVLARDAGVRTEVLSTIESLTPAQRRAGADYESLMRRNLTRLREALGCD